MGTDLSSIWRNLVHFVYVLHSLISSFSHTQKILLQTSSKTSLSFCEHTNALLVFIWRIFHCEIKLKRLFEFGAKWSNMYARAQLARIQNHQNKTHEFVKKNLSKQRMSNLKVVKSKNSIDERGFNQEKKYNLAISANVIVLKVRYL